MQFLTTYFFLSPQHELPSGSWAHGSVVKNSPAKAGDTGSIPE